MGRSGCPAGGVRRDRASRCWPGRPGRWCATGRAHARGSGPRRPAGPLWVAPAELSSPARLCRRLGHRSRPGCGPGLAGRLDARYQHRAVRDTSRHHHGRRLDLDGDVQRDVRQRLRRGHRAVREQSRPQLAIDPRRQPWATDGPSQVMPHLQRSHRAPVLGRHRATALWAILHGGRARFERSPVPRLLRDRGSERRRQDWPIAARLAYVPRESVAKATRHHAGDGRARGTLSAKLPRPLTPLFQLVY